MSGTCSLTGSRCQQALFDFGLAFFHNARVTLDRGSGPYFYLPKMESHLEARLWNAVFDYSESQLGVPHGSIKCTVLIEHILAAFEIEEILYELRDHITGLNLGRWDYIFSVIKVFNQRPDFVFPDRAQVTMGTHFLRSAAEAHGAGVPQAWRARFGRHVRFHPQEGRSRGQ